MAALSEALERLAAAKINLLPISANAHFIFERDGFVALVERKNENEFGRIGTAGLATAKGFAALVWRGKQAFFVGHGVEQPASTEQVYLLRNFQQDLEESLT